MKVLQVNCVYKKGSTGKITYDLHKGLQEAGIESVVCYGRGELVNEPGVYKTCPEWYSKLNNAISRVTGVMYGGCFFSTNKLISIIKREKPDVVHLQCLNGYFVNIYRLVNWLKKSHIKTVLTLHAEFMYTGGCGHAVDCNQWREERGCGYSKCPYLRSETKSLFINGTGLMWNKMKRAVDGFEDSLIITSVSPWLRERAESGPILKAKRHCVIYNGLDTSVFHLYSDEEYGEERNRLRIDKGRRIFLHVTPYFSIDPNHIKGGFYIAKLAESMPEDQFVVAGSYMEGIQVPDNLMLLGKIQDQSKLALLYSMADAVILTSKRETFSMVTAESLCCGTPVIGFNAGAPEQIALPLYSSFCDYGRIDLLKNALNDIGNKYMSKRKIEKEAHKLYGKETMVENYKRCYFFLTETKERKTVDGKKESGF